MPRVRFRVRVDGRPLRRAYVEHIVLGVGGEMYITDNEGRVRDKNGDMGIDSLTNTADVRILCQNSIAKVLDGSTIPIPFAVNQDKSGVRTGDIINLNTAREQHAHYAILNQCVSVYDVVFRQFRPFSDLARPSFPLGRRNSLRSTKDQLKRIEISYPSRVPLAQAAFVEASSGGTGFPLLQILDRRVDGRLFGENGSNPTLIASELAHALHFSLFSSGQRIALEADYLAWITSDVANGGDGSHFMTKQTNPMVAYIEALDHFSSRFAEFVRQNEQNSARVLQPQNVNSTIRRAFLKREREGTSLEGANVATTVNGRIVPSPTLGGANDEGSVYGCIFVDFATRVGMLTAVNAYLRSAADGVRTFGMYKDWINDNSPQHLRHLEAAQRTWRL